MSHDGSPFGRSGHSRNFWVQAKLRYIALRYIKITMYKQNSQCFRPRNNTIFAKDENIISFSMKITNTH